jgi:hypothetical protein
VHIVVNNQVGFTTSPMESRSSVYATDVARMIQAPIFHVNGDDPEAVARVGRLSFAYREAFRKDVVIDMVCYRRRGHNEGDNPSFTQPLMYDLIEARRSVRKLYTESLIARGDLTMEEAEAALRDYQQQLERAFTETREAAELPAQPGTVLPPEVGDRPVDHAAVPTAISLDAVKQIIETQVSIPDGFTVHPRLKPQLDRRATSVSEDTIDWATGELLAFGSVLQDGYPVRLVGQDSRRGTFGQRHSVLVDRTNGTEYTPLRKLDNGKARFFVYDSLLSEFAAMGFEYGYSVARPDALVLWEAQFGDFADGRLYAEVAAASQGGHVGDGGLHPRLVPAADRRAGRLRRGQGPPGGALHRQDLLRPRRAPRQAWRHRHRDRPGRAALPDPRAGAAGRTLPLPRRRRDCLGAGGAGEPGRLAADGAAAAGAHRPPAPAGRTAGQLGAGVRLRKGARGDAP